MSLGSGIGALLQHLEDTFCSYKSLKITPVCESETIGLSFCVYLLLYIFRVIYKSFLVLKNKAPLLMVVFMGDYFSNTRGGSADSSCVEVVGTQGRGWPLLLEGQQRNSNLRSLKTPYSF